MMKKILCAVLTIILFSGCFHEDKAADVYFNLSDLTSFAENNEFYFTSRMTYSDNSNVLIELIAADKKTGESFEAIRNNFDDNITADYFCAVNNSLYFMTFIDSRGFSLYEISLDDYNLEQRFFQSSETNYSYLGLMIDNTVKLDKTVIGFFTDGKALYLITDNYEIYQTDFSLNNPKCIISDGIYDRNLIYNGNIIYYINDNFELKAYNTCDTSETMLSDDLIFTFDIDGEYLIYSNNSGIFIKNLLNEDKTELIDHPAEKISAKNGSVVFSENSRLYSLSNGNVKEVYNGIILNFSIMSDGETVFLHTADNNGLVNEIIDINIE